MGICDTETEFDRVWPFLEPALAKDIGGATWTKEELKAELGLGAAIWTTEHSATLVHFIGHPRMRVMNVWAAGGNLRDILDVTLPLLVEWGKANGVKYIIGAAGHKAWGRALKKYGFEPQHITFAKEL